MIYAVIMAGGSGTRFWPRSTQKKPKQFLNLFGGHTMIQETVNRLEGFISPENVLVVTNDNYVEIVADQLPATKKQDIIGEPVAKNTAPCVAAAAAQLYRKDPESVMVVLPADHRISNSKEFISVLSAAVETAKTENSLVTIGIKPNRPETGYGYIRFDENTELEKRGRSVYKVRNFTEKPELAAAQSFLKSGDYLWNSGMFIWKTSSVLEAFKTYLPEVYSETKKLMDSEITQEAIDQFYHSCPSVSIDYGIMEKAETVHVVPGDFGWNDVGSWVAVHELTDKDRDGNAVAVKDTPVSIQNSSNNLIHSSSGKIIALVGVDNLAVVETDEAILVVNLEQAQGVKNVVEELKKDPDKKKYL